MKTLYEIKLLEKKETILKGLFFDYFENGSLLFTFDCSTLTKFVSVTQQHCMLINKEDKSKFKV